MLSDKEVRRRYGDEAVISRSCGFVLVHLDQPVAELVRERTATFDPDDYFEPGCPMCDVQRAERLVIFDAYGNSPEEEILLE